MNQAATPLLSAQNLSYSHNGEHMVFEQIDLSIGRCEIVALLGASGCGKSSLLRLLAGLVPPLGGKVEFLGQPLSQPHPRSALVFQQASLLPWLNLFDNASFGLDFRHQPPIERQARQERVRNALAAVGLQGREKAWPAELSGGQAQRVALARALAREPELLFADEPFSALDAITRAEMQRLLVTLVQRWHTAVLLVTHDIDEALLVADRILLMGEQPGRILHSWTLDTPQPREADHPSLLQLRGDILAALRQHKQAAPASTSASHSPLFSSTSPGSGYSS